MHYNVVFCTPGHSMTSNYVKAFAQTSKALSASGISWTYQNGYSSLVAHAREMTVGGPGYQNAANTIPFQGAFTYDMLMWIDSDISWEPIDFFRLYESDKPIISGCYQIENNTVTAYREPMGAAISAAEILTLRAPFEVFGVGFGFLAVKQGVFEAMKRPWFAQEEIAIMKEDGTLDYKFPLMGEDLSWCNKVQKLGIPIWVDPKVRVSHRKTLLLDWSDVNTDWSR